LAAPFPLNDPIERSIAAARTGDLEFLDCPLDGALCIGRLNVTDQAGWRGLDQRYCAVPPQPALSPRTDFEIQILKILREGV
jgi:hypothetical protein